jgi:ABC-type transport system involved in multi-copper enzyme maturation permease subunit/regulation of enolase protein 1 (concanavalin A-like superfamily)
MRRELRAELTKLRSVRSTAVALLATIGLTLLITILSAQGSNTFANDGPHTVDQFHFVHQQLTGDGSITARVASQKDTGAWAKAGIMIKDGTKSGSPYAALMVTPRHGVRMQANAKTELSGSAVAAPHWLRLTRSGQTVTGWESADGTTWRKVATFPVAGLPADAQAGLFVASPPRPDYRQEGPGSISLGYQPTTGRAVFEQVSIAGPAGQPAAPWQNTDVAEPPPTPQELTHFKGGGIPRVEGRPGSAARHGVAFTVTGSGDIGRVGMGGIKLPIDVDTVKESLVGVQIGLIAVVALSVLFMTSEFKTRTIRTTFTACPRRSRVLAAKAIVLAGTVFAVGLAASIAAFFLAQPFQRENGFAPPAYPHPALTDPTVLRAVVGTALFLAVLAVFSLGVATILRGTAGAIVLIFALLIVVPIVASVTSVAATTWVNRATPIAGLAIQQTTTLTETAIGPWAGFSVLCGYAAAALGCAAWLLRKRDA